MFVLYKNRNDDYEEHIGEVLSNLRNFKTAEYIDIIPKGHLVTGEFDYKHLHIDFVDVKNIIAFGDTEKALKLHRAEAFI